MTLVDKQLEGKETQPPARFGQGTLIELMEKHNLGTKATRHAIIQNLYDRGYVRSNPVEPTEMGIKMAEAIQDFAPRIASPEMTAELEKDMDLISVRDMTKEEVVTVSRNLLREAYGMLEQHKEQMAAKIYEGITEDRILGECPKCAKARLRVIRSKTTKKRFVGCEGYPDCDQTYPLPQKGEVIGTDEICPQCGSPKVKILGGRRPWILCLDPYCPTKDEYRAKVAARVARAAAEEAEGGTESAAPKAAAKGRATKAAAASKTGTAKKATSTKTGATKTATAAKTTVRKKAATTKRRRRRRRPRRRPPPRPPRRRPRPRRRPGASPRPRRPRPLRRRLPA